MYLIFSSLLNSAFAYTIPLFFPWVHSTNSCLLSTLMKPFLTYLPKPCHTKPELVENKFTYMIISYTESPLKAETELYLKHLILFWHKCFLMFKCCEKI